MTRTVVVLNVLVEKPVVVFSGTVVGEEERRRFVAEARVVPRAPMAGEIWRVGGRVTRHPIYGNQVIVEDAVLEKPSGRLIVYVLASARFPGVGRKTSERLWRAYGEGLYEILADGDENALVAITGSDLRGLAQAATIAEGWQGLALEADVMKWLDRHAISPKLALKIIGCYGDEAITALSADPYRLIVFGAGWEEADGIAQSLGLNRDHPQRLCAAVEHCLHRRFTAFGDTVVAAEDLKRELAKLVGSDAIAEAIDTAKASRAVLPTPSGWQSAGCAALEAFIADDIVRRLTKKAFVRQSPEVTVVRKQLDAWQINADITLNRGQRGAVEMALTSGFAIVTGGAGTGKTAIISAICSLASTFGEQSILLALSGRAALRITEATGLAALTIAGFLQRYESSPTQLPSRLLTIVDEASMVDVTLLYRLISLLEHRGRLLLVGDPGQLPPIGPGLTLHALIGHVAVPIAVLDEVVRQAADTGIPTAGVEIRHGIVPSAIVKKCGPGVHFIDAQAEAVANLAITLRDEGDDRTQILSAFKGRPTSGGGARHINELCHSRRSSGPVWFERFGRNEPVIWTQNDYDIGLMNGELGVVRTLVKDTDNGTHRLRVDFGNKELFLTQEKVASLELAYAITVHKAQGSQFDRVIVPIVDHPILDRTLIYTALTRARFEAVFVGDRGVFRRAIIDPPSVSRRRSALAWHLDEGLRVSASGTRNNMLTEL